MKAKLEVIERWSTRNKCFMCKHRFEKPMLLEVAHPEPGKLQPNFNTSFLFHLYDTHGLPPEIVGDWLFGSVYGLELTEMGFRIND